MTTPPPEAPVDDFDDAEDAPPPDDSGSQDVPDPDESDLGEAGQRALTRMKQERANARRQVTTLQRELDQLRAASQTEAEKSITAAEARGRSSALGEIGVRLARAEFDTLAARRNPQFDTDDVVTYVDMSKFLDEDSEVDVLALSAAVDRLVPAAPEGPPSQDGGARRTARPKSMNEIIRDQALGGRAY